ncbi:MULTISPECIES: Hpt domain-containing protein [unclassified Saccharicrinis]|uniref:Hpt domain-containing protein n=1 Tax=unclassified Saccharicrinis TaxID=2646859 RepID=UPI003D33A658
MVEDYKYIDLSYLEGIAEGDKEIIKELVEIFLDQMPEFTDGFAESMTDKDWVKVAAIAHKAKSSVMSMGMEELGSIDLKNMELLAKQLRINELSVKESITESQKEEIVNLKRNLESYPDSRVTWVVENADKETLESLIEKFTTVCNKAVDELNKVISTY